MKPGTPKITCKTHEWVVVEAAAANRACRAPNYATQNGVSTLNRRCAVCPDRNYSLSYGKLQPHKIGKTWMMPRAAHGPDTRTHQIELTFMPLPIRPTCLNPCVIMKSSASLFVRTLGRAWHRCPTWLVMLSLLVSAAVSWGQTNGVYQEVYTD